MRYEKIGIVVCLTALLCGACASREQAELDAAWQKVEANLDEMEQKIQEKMAEAKQDAIDGLEEVNWAEALLSWNGEEREKRLYWVAADAPAVETDLTARAAALRESLSFDEWVLCEEAPQDLEEEGVYSIRQQRSVGLLDSETAGDVDLGYIVLYRDADVVYAGVTVLEDTPVPDVMDEILGEDAVGSWFGGYYEVPQADLETLRTFCEN